MNKDNILAVADAIEKQAIPDLDFNMDIMFTCIECWAYRVAGNPPTRDSHAIERVAHDFLDIDEGSDLSTNLFLYYRYPPKTRPQVSEAERHSITAQRAVAVLRHLAETGEVDWSKAKAA